MSTALIHIFLLLLNLIPETQGVGIQLHVMSEELTVTAVGTPSLNFSAKGPITSSSGKISIGLQDAYAAIYMLQYPANHEVVVVIEADADLRKEGAPTVKIPLTVKAAYNIGTDNKGAATPATTDTVIIPESTSPSTVTTYLYIYGDMGPGTASYTPGNYVGDITLRISLSEAVL